MTAKCMCKLQVVSCATRSSYLASRTLTCTRSCLAESMSSLGKYFTPVKREMSEAMEPLVVDESSPEHAVEVQATQPAEVQPKSKAKAKAKAKQRTRAAKQVKAEPEEGECSSAQEVVKEGDMQATEAMLSSSERKAKWEEFKRTLVLVKERASRTAKCPEHVALELVSSESKNEWFQKWLAAGCDWGQVTISKDFVEHDVDKGLEVDAWLTEGQLKLLYNDPVVVSALVKTKAANAETWRPRPEIPTCKEAVQYKCRVKTEQLHELEKKTSTRTNLRAELSTEAAKVWLPQVIKSQRQPLTQASSTADVNTTGGPEPRSEKYAKRKERDEAKAQKAEEHTRQREAYKSSAKYKATQWVNKLNADLNAAQDASIKAKRSARMPGNLANEYASAFSEHCRRLTELRAMIEAAIGADSDDQIAAALKTAEPDVKSFKRDIGVFQRAYNSYERS